jgi:hypothetical protein
MNSAASNPRQQAHELIDRLEPGQISAVVRLLQVILNPSSSRQMHASAKDGFFSEGETLALVREWLYTRGIPDEQVLAEFDLAAEDFKHLDRTAPDAHEPNQKL